MHRNNKATNFSGFLQTKPSKTLLYNNFVSRKTAKNGAKSAKKPR